MSENLAKIQNMLRELNDAMESYLNLPKDHGETISPSLSSKLQEQLRNTETKAMSLIELFLTEETKTEASTWGQQGKDDLGQTGLELFKKIETIDKLIAPRENTEENAEEIVPPGPLTAAGMAAAAAVMQLLCVIRAFTQIINYLLIDATLAITYIMRDKIQNVIHISKGTYSEVHDAWRLRCS